ncbi:MAG: L,D-transpeptidase [Gammaproteobacteria bacterium]|nr:L,D-transpeptidase [Gammaproteobacteria bacterium]
MEIDIDLSAQRLRLCDGEHQVMDVAVSTGANGIGEQNGSGCTPRGRHQVRAKIGQGAPPGAVFRGRRWTGEVWTPEAHDTQPGRDWILTRILWLSGLEPGRNRLGPVDTFRRYIYLHGTPPVTALGTPGSKGCIRMNNADIIRLFDLVAPGTVVNLHE